MEVDYKYGEEVEYSEMTIIKPEDKNKLQAFCCGNDILDNYIHNEIFDDRKKAQGLHFIFTDNKNGKVICFVSLSASGIIYKVDKHIEILPGIKIDVFAVDVKYQKMIFDEESSGSNDHYYLSDDLMCCVINHCRNIDENYALVDYVLLYADKKAERFYVRNKFGYYTEYMEQENNMEIKENIPMFLSL